MFKSVHLNMVYTYFFTILEYFPYNPIYIHCRNKHMTYIQFPSLFMAMESITLLGVLRSHPSNWILLHFQRQCQHWHSSMLDLIYRFLGRPLSGYFWFPLIIFIKFLFVLCLVFSLLST